MQLRLAVADGAFQHVGDLVVLVAFDIVQNEDEPVTWGKIGDGAFQRDPIDGSGEHEVARADVLARTVFLRGFQGLFKRDLGQTLLAQVHEHDIDREAVQPGGECRVAAEGADLAIELQKGFLGQVFGFGYVTQHAQAQGVDATLMQRVEALKGGSVAALRSGDGLCLPGDGGIAAQMLIGFLALGGRCR